jgi:hypothetical protein
MAEETQLARMLELTSAMITGPPATREEIAIAEQQLGRSLPEDYVAFMLEEAGARATSAHSVGHVCTPCAHSPPSKLCTPSSII